MATHEAACSCGQLRVEVDGDPVRVSVCHCLACQRRTGSAFGYQARWPAESARVTGESHEYRRISDDEAAAAARSDGFTSARSVAGRSYYFTEPEFMAIPVGVLADPDFPEPTVSVWESRKHAWVTMPDGVTHHH